MGSERTITVTYDPASPSDFSGLSIMERYNKDEYKCHNVLLKENADIMLKILTDQETAKRAIDYIKSTECIKIPGNHVVIDFDLKDGGMHLHYICDTGSKEKSCKDCRYWLMNKDDECRRCRYCNDMDEFLSWEVYDGKNLG